MLLLAATKARLLRSLCAARNERQPRAWQPGAVMIAMLAAVALSIGWSRVACATGLAYNNDTTCMYLTPSVTPAQVRGFVDEVAGTQVDRYLVCAAEMVSYFPSTTVEWLGDSRTPPPGSNPSVVTTAQALGNLVAQGYDPVGLVLDEAKQKGMKALITYRMNDIHDTDQADSLQLSSFWKNNPGYRISSSNAALNYSVLAVRQHYLSRLQECINRYGGEMDGLELDFQRNPSYFSRVTSSARSTMTTFVSSIRQMLNQYGQTHDKTLELSVRVLPTITQSRAIGLDPVKWAQQGLVDSITVSRFLYNDEGPLDIAGYQNAIPNIPIYSSIEAVKDGTGSTTTPSEYLTEAEALRVAGSDGNYLFNFCYIHSPEYLALLNQMGVTVPEPSTMAMLVAAAMVLLTLRGFGVKCKPSRS